MCGCDRALRSECVLFCVQKGASGAVPCIWLQARFSSNSQGSWRRAFILFGAPHYEQCEHRSPRRVSADWGHDGVHDDECNVPSAKQSERRCLMYLFSGMVGELSTGQLEEAICLVWSSSLQWKRTLTFKKSNRWWRSWSRWCWLWWVCLQWCCLWRYFCAYWCCSCLYVVAMVMVLLMMLLLVITVWLESC